jgi:2-amino-4-hydroxy-6-hydroxymethyldihydropteridine diphosphokinase
LTRSLRRASTFAIAPSRAGQALSPGSPIGTASAYVGIGANLGERAETIAAAVQLLAAEKGVEVVAVSTLRETPPVGWEDQPRFLNAAALVETELPPRMLLERLLEIEARLGRIRGAGPRFGPRTIDLDLLLYGDETIDEPGLSVPHPRLHERRFALEPLAELDPDLEVPGRGPVWALLAGL